MKHASNIDVQYRPFGAACVTGLKLRNAAMVILAASIFASRGQRRLRAADAHARRSVVIAIEVMEDHKSRVVALSR